MQIDVSFDSSVANAPSGFVTAVNYVVSYLDSLFTNNVTINIDVGYGEIDGQSLEYGALGESLPSADNQAGYLYTTSYASLKAALLAENAPGASTLPATAPISGNVALTAAEAKALGLITSNSGPDGYVGFSSAPNQFSYGIGTTPPAGEYYFVGVVEHEITEVMGRISLVDQEPSWYSPMDLFRYSSPGVRDTTTGGSGSTAYFSINNGATNLGSWNNNANNGDLGDWYPSGPAAGGDDSFNDYSSPGVINVISQNDLTLLEAIGWTTQSNGIAVASPSADAVQGGAAVAALAGPPTITDANHSTLTSASVTITNSGGSAVAGDELFLAGEQSGSVDSGLITVSWNASTDTLTLTGTASISTYETLLDEITYQDTGTDLSSGSHPVRTLTWTVNDGTSTFSSTSQITIDRLPVANPDAASVAEGTTVTATAATGVLANDSDLDGDSLSVTGIDHTVLDIGSVGQPLTGTYGTLTLDANGSYSYTANNLAAINGAPTGSALTDTFTYTVSDGIGSSSSTLTFTVTRPPIVTAANISLTSSQASVPASSLFSVSIPDGNPITTYQFSDTGGGYFVLNGVQQANNQTLTIPATQLAQLTYQSAAGTADTVQIRAYDGSLWSNWTSFVVTAPPLVIQMDGSTSLEELASNYLLSSGGASVGLWYGNWQVNASGTWKPIGAVQTATGYDVAWTLPGANQYTIWSTDSTGHYTSNLIGLVPGTSTDLEAYESIFDQDLNGDGVITTPAVIQTDGATSLDQVGNNYFLYTAGKAVSLWYGNWEVTTSGTWKPIGAVQTATGYDVAWTLPGANQYTIWSIDSSGDYISNLIGDVSGTSSDLEAFELIFNQDLNGDGVISAPVVLQADKGTLLDQIGDNYLLYTAAGYVGLSYGSWEVTTSGNWKPIGAVQTATGFDVAWTLPGANLYTIWGTDSSGNYISNLIGEVAGTSTDLEAYESIFNQDLNGDGVVTAPTVIQTDGATSLSQVGNNYFLYTAGQAVSLWYGNWEVTAAGTWKPIGAVQTATGYDVAWTLPGANQYTIWSVNSSGDYVSNLIGDVSGTSAALEQFESVFNQDLNGDGVIGLYAAPGGALQINESGAASSQPATIGAGATLELVAGNLASVTFQSSTGKLQLDQPSSFSGSIIGFSGDGTLAGSDGIDLPTIHYSSAQESYSGGTLTVSDASGDSASLNFVGSYTLANFSLANDGAGGTIVYDPPAGFSAGAAEAGQSVRDGHSDQQLVPSFNAFLQAVQSGFGPQTFGPSVLGEQDRGQGNQLWPGADQEVVASNPQNRLNTSVLS